MYREGGTALYLDKGFDPEIEGYKTEVHPEILAELWRDIRLEYTQLMDNGTLSRILTIALRLEQYRIKFDMTNTCIAYLSMYYAPEVIMILKDLGFVVKSNPNLDVESYLLELSRIKTLAKHFEVEMDMLQGELDAANSNNSNKKSEDEDEWMDTLLLLEDDCGFHLEESKMTVYEYIRRVKKYIKKIKLKMQQARKGNAVQL